MRDFRTASEDFANRKGARHLLFLILATLVAATYISFVVVAAIHTHNRVGLGGAPMFYDFSVFHQAAALANQGHAADAYDDRKMIAAEHAAFPGSKLRLPWHYPPSFQLLLMPLGALPYIPAWLIWSCGLYGFYAMLARRLVHEPERLWLLLLAPGAAVNLFFGQNGILSIVLMGGGVLSLRSRPVWGGILLGMTAYKPQLALLVPFALLFGKEWRALTAAVVSQAALMGLSILVIGIDPWIGFFNKITHPAAIFSSSSSDWRAIPSMMIFARTIGLGPLASSALHWTIATFAALAALLTWHKTKDGHIRAAVLAAATLLVTPYLRIYDLFVLTLPLAVLLRGETNPVEKAILCAAWLMPGVLMFATLPIQIGPLVSLSLLAAILWHAARPATSRVSQ